MDITPRLVPPAAIARVRRHLILVERAAREANEALALAEHVTESTPAVEPPSAMVMHNGAPHSLRKLQASSAMQHAAKMLTDVVSLSHEIDILIEPDPPKAARVLRIEGTANGDGEH